MRTLLPIGLLMMFAGLVLPDALPFVSFAIGLPLAAIGAIASGRTQTDARKRK